jgi:hypothetical protein
VGQSSFFYKMIVVIHIGGEEMEILGDKKLDIEIR